MSDSRPHVRAVRAKAEAAHYAAHTARLAVDVDDLPTALAHARQAEQDSRRLATDLARLCQDRNSAAR